MEAIDVAVAGAGVTGLATARALARTGRSVCVLERHQRPGLDTSTRNSGVIHAGLYNPPGSLKSTLCVRGNALLYDYCLTHGVPHARCGKVVVACDASELDGIDQLLANAQANGVKGLMLLDAAGVRAREPHVRAVAALLSPTTGIIDAEALVRTLARDAVEAGAVLLPGTPLLGARPSGDGVVLDTPHESMFAAQVVNAAGLYADEVSALLGGETFTIHPCRGEYATVVPAKRHLVNGLVYPLPLASGHGLGTHTVKTIDGEVWLGPTVHYQARKDDYTEDRAPVDEFLAPARRLFPGLEPGDLRLGSSGIRPKLHGPGASFADFLIRRDTRNPHLVHAAGIESPGLTACLAIGEHIASLLIAEG